MDIIAKFIAYFLHFFPTFFDNHMDPWTHGLMDLLTSSFLGFLKALCQAPDVPDPEGEAIRAAPGSARGLLRPSCMSVASGLLL